jgi:hypothetical protein
MKMIKGDASGNDGFEGLGNSLDSGRRRNDGLVDSPSILLRVMSLSNGLSAGLQNDKA